MRSPIAASTPLSLIDLVSAHAFAPPFDAPLSTQTSPRSAATSPSRIQKMRSASPVSLDMATAATLTSPTSSASPPTSPQQMPSMHRAQTEPVTDNPRQAVSRSATVPSDLAALAEEGERKRSFDSRGRGRGAHFMPVRGKSLEADGDRLVLEKYTLYETKTVRATLLHSTPFASMTSKVLQKFYIVGYNQADTRYRILKVDRTVFPATPPNPNESDQDDDAYPGLSVTEDAAIYSREELDQLLNALGAGNAGGIQMVIPKFYGIAGFVRFTSTYYMVLIMTRAPVALIGGHYVYHCETTSLRPISPVPSARNAEEARLIAAFQNVDLSKNFYFSCSYDLTHTLQHNLTQSETPRKDGKLTDYNDKWVWNRHLLKPAVRHLKDKSPWILPLIHGFVDQAKLSVFGRPVYITLIARRSRHFAGARFLKRGVNDQGYVANDVETEQIVSDALTTPFYSVPPTGGPRKPNSRYTSFVQVRGSIPLYWSQESINMSPKPPIELTIVDPYFSAAALHFDDLLGRYGGPITVLNLIKQKERQPRESKLLGEFKECIDYLNQFLPADQHIKYNAWDLAAANKQRDKDVIGVLEDIAEEALESTNFFHTGPEPSWYALNRDADTPQYRSTPLLQHGVVRTNCIDCLDRTNAAQFVIAKAALGHQLHSLGIIHHPRLPFDSDAVNLITEMFHDHGDTIALQYGGSHLVNTMDTYRKIGQWTSHSRDMIENVKRYYSNSFVDADKQAAIDLFLGIDNTPPLPTLHLKSNPRRSYRDWFTPQHLEPFVEPSDALTNITKAVERDDNYWFTYYRPLMFTDFKKLYAFTVNSTAKYDTSGPPLGSHSEPKDLSPFTPRVSHSAAGPKINVGSGVRRWMSHRSRSKPAQRTSRIPSQRVDETSPAPPPPLNTTESLISRLLNPIVVEAEAKEYASYIDQFAHLSLSQDLSEKDALLYRSSAAIGAAGSELVKLQVDRSNMAVYSEAIKISRPGQELRGSEMGHGMRVVGPWEAASVEEK
ncbi:phosphatidylinositol 3,5-bisphosphate 5-phosphatase, partial [Phenoliferia sp. Uapishka_3]